MRARVVVAVAGAMLAAPGAGAQEGGVGDWFGANVSVTSDYTFRGISQTLEEPAIQGGMDLAHPSGAYLGAWGSSVNFGEDLAVGPRAQLELDAYGGYAASVPGLLELDLGFVYYMYPGADGGRNYDFLEVGMGASRAVGPVSAGLGFAYSPDFYAASGQGVYYGAEVGVPVSVLAISGSVGRQSIEENDVFGTPDYTEWGVGASVGFMGFDLGAKLVSTDVPEAECFGGSDLCGSRVVVSVARAL